MNGRLSNVVQLNFLVMEGTFRLVAKERSGHGLMPILSVDTDATCLTSFRRFRTGPLRRIRRDGITLLFVQIMTTGSETREGRYTLLTTKLLLHFRQGSPVSSMQDFLLN